MLQTLQSHSHFWLRWFDLDLTRSFPSLDSSGAKRRHWDGEAPEERPEENQSPAGGRSDHVGPHKEQRAQQEGDRSAQKPGTTAAALKTADKKARDGRSRINVHLGIARAEPTRESRGRRDNWITKYTVTDAGWGRPRSARFSRKNVTQGYWSKRKYLTQRRSAVV